MRIAAAPAVRTTCTGPTHDQRSACRNIAQSLARASRRSAAQDRCAARPDSRGAPARTTDRGASPLRVLPRPSRSVRLESPGRSASTARARHRELDALFAFGIDPVNGNTPDEPPSAWPDIATIRAYNRDVRHTLDASLPHALDAERFGEQFGDATPMATLIDAAIEHRLMHAETLAYMINQSSIARCVRGTMPVPVPRLQHRARAHSGRHRDARRRARHAHVRLGQRARRARGRRARSSRFRAAWSAMAITSRFVEAGGYEARDVLDRRGLGVARSERDHASRVLGRARTDAGTGDR